MYFLSGKKHTENHLEAYGQTDIGKKRLMNQDFIFVSTEEVGALPNLFVLADGMGGHSAGDTASSMLTENFCRVVGQTRAKEPIRVFDTALQLSNWKVYQKSLSSPAFAGMGSTLVAACIDGDTLSCINVGDSRLYVISEGSIRQITRDHSLVEEMVRSGIMERGSEDYLKQKNILTRAVGIDPSVEADCYDEKLSDGDLVLLASDGLTNMLSDQEICDTVLGEEGVKAAVSRLIEKANDNGGSDNIAVILIRFRKEGEPDDQRR